MAEAARGAAKVPRMFTDALARWHFRRTDFVFILAPMRSGTTLLQHLLAQDPRMLSAGETHLVYRAPRDLGRLVRKVYRYNGYLGLQPRSMVEKCVTDELIPDATVLRHPRLRAVFLLRDPVATVGSLLALKERNWVHSETPEAAAEYYLRRLADLERLAAAVPDRAHGFFLAYEDLVDRTSDALAALSRFLALPQPLREEYAPQRWTGVAMRGDLSTTIWQGSIARGERRRAPDLPDALRERLVATQHRTEAVLAARCTVVPPAAGAPAP